LTIGILIATQTSSLSHADKDTDTDTDTGADTSQTTIEAATERIDNLRTV